MKTNVSVRIMDSDYPLLCEAEEKALLVKSAEYLNYHLKAFRRDNPSVDVEKVLMMGALRVTCDLMRDIEELSDKATVANGEIEKTLDKLK